jgi:hypothetical protein
MKITTSPRRIVRTHTAAFVKTTPTTTATDRIELLYKDGTLRDIAEASDNLGIAALSRPVEKFYLAWPRWLGKEWFEGIGKSEEG